MDRDGCRRTNEPQCFRSSPRVEVTGAQPGPPAADRKQGDVDALRCQIGHTGEAVRVSGEIERFAASNEIPDGAGLQEAREPSMPGLRCRDDDGADRRLLARPELDGTLEPAPSETSSRPGRPDDEGRRIEQVQRRRVEMIPVEV
jgi:hypothetical protein